MITLVRFNKYNWSSLMKTLTHLVLQMNLPLVIERYGHMGNSFIELNAVKVKGALSGLRQCLATASPLKTMKNAFYFTLKVFFAVKIFTFLTWLFGYVEKRFDQKDKANVKVFDVTNWLTNNCNTDITQYFKKWRQSDNELWSVNRIKQEKHCSWKTMHKIWWRNCSQTLL